MAFSLHSHSGQFCGHAQNDLEEMVQRAIELQMPLYSLTEHMPRTHDGDLYPEEVRVPLPVSSGSVQSRSMADSRCHRLRPA